MSIAEFDSRTGTVTAEPALLDALAREVDPLPGALREAGAVRDGRPHPGLERVLDALHHPDHGTLRLTYKGRSLDGWVGATRTALLTPAHADGRRALVRVHPTLVPGALAKVVALQPRPRATDERRAEDLAGDPGTVRWWTLRHSPSGHRAGCLLEVVDTDGGLYVVDDRGTATPTDPSSVFRLIVRAVRGEPGDPAAPLRALPTEAAVPAPWA